MYKIGELYSFTLRDGLEVIGEYAGRELSTEGIGNPSKIGEYIINIKNYCLVFETPPPQPNLPAQKIMFNGSEGGSFTEDMPIYEHQIILVRPILKGSEIYTLYRQNIDNVEEEHKEYKS